METGLRKLSALRSQIEGYAAREAAERAARHPEAMESLLAHLASLTAAVRARDYLAFRDADFALHETIVNLADVPCLPEVWLTVWNGLADFHQRGFEDCFPEPRFLSEEHEYLVEAIVLGDPAAAEDAARSHIEAVWFRLAEKEGDATLRSDTERPDPLQRAAAHIAFQLHRPLLLEKVAREIAFTSAGHLSRLFRQHYGVGFQAYLQQLRLEKAAELLCETRLPITTIARRVGYRDLSRFGQHFKRRYHDTPREWRSQPRK